MGVAVMVRHDLAGLEKRLRLYPKELLAADVRAKNRTATATRAEAARRLQVLLKGLRIGTIKRQMKITRATSGNTKASLSFSAGRFRLFGNFNARQTKRGVRITGTPWRLETSDGEVVPTQILAHAFIQRGTSRGTVNVLLRTSTPRYPIVAVFASSLATAFRDARLGNTFVQFGRERHKVFLGQEMKYRLSQREGQIDAR